MSQVCENSHKGSWYHSASSWHLCFVALVCAPRSPQRQIIIFQFTDEDPKIKGHLWLTQDHRIWGRVRTGSGFHVHGSSHENIPPEMADLSGSHSKITQSRAKSQRGFFSHPTPTPTSRKRLITTHIPFPRKAVFCDPLHWTRFLQVFHWLLTIKLCWRSEPEAGSTLRSACSLLLQATGSFWTLHVYCFINSAWEAWTGPHRLSKSNNAPDLGSQITHLWFSSKAWEGKNVNIKN